MCIRDSLYTDSKFNNEFYSSSSSNTFEVSKSGTVGISTDAGLTLIVNDSLPEALFYKFTPVQGELISDIKKELIIDKEVVGYNQVDIKDSVYSGSFEITGIGTTTTFTYNVLSDLESNSYSLSEAEIKYFTSSTNTYGPISNIELKSKGNYYTETVGVASIRTGIGTGAILESESDTIGKINSTKIQNIGFDFPTDTTLRPVLNLSEVLIMEPLNSLSEIGITSVGKNYLESPGLVLLDGLTNKVVSDVELDYELGDTQVSILKNTKTLNNVTPIIIPTSNSSGYTINNIDFNSGTKDVTITIGASFSDAADYPFEVGKKVMIEGVSVGLGSTGTGYNSEDYDYTCLLYTSPSPRDS